MFRRRSLLFRFFISYMLVILVPIALIFALLYRWGVMELKDEVRSFNIKTVQQFKDNVDLRTQEFRSIAAQISLNPKLSYYNMVRNNYMVIEGINELVKLSAGNAFANDILIYYNAHSSLFSSSGSTSMDVLLKSKYFFSDDQVDDFNAQLAQIRTPVMINFGSPRTHMYLVPFPTTGHFIGTVIFVIPTKHLEGLYGETARSFSNSLYILDSAFRPLYMFGDNSEDNVAALSSFMSDSHTSISELRLGGNDYSVIHIPSEETGWHYVMTIPNKPFGERIAAQTLLVIGSTILVLLICLLIAVPLTFSHYRPIRNLKQLLHDHNLLKKENVHLSEMDHINLAVDNAVALNQSLTTQLDQHRTLLKQHYLVELLGDGGGHSAEQAEWLDAVKFTDADSHFLVCMLQYEESSTAELNINGAITDFVTNQLDQSHGSVYVVELGGDDKTIVLVLHRLRCSPDAKHIAQAVLHYAKTLDIQSARIGISKPHNHVRQLKQSFIEAAAALEMPLHKPANSIVFFEEMTAEHDPVWQHNEHEVILKHSVKQGDYTLAAEMFQLIIDQLRVKPLPAFMLKYAQFRLIHTLAEHVGQLAKQRRDVMEAFTHKVHDALQTATLPEFAAVYNELLRNGCELVMQKEHEQELGIIDHVSEYVKQHFKDPNISLDSLALKFGYSNYFWSRFFKENIGVHFTDYLWKLRCDEVKRLMLHTHKPLKDIIVEVGYIDLTSFSRKFKSDEGITPGKYRKLYQADS